MNLTTSQIIRYADYAHEHLTHQASLGNSHAEEVLRTEQWLTHAVSLDDVDREWYLETIGV